MDSESDVTLELHEYSFGPADLMMRAEGSGYKVAEAVIAWHCSCGVAGQFDELLSLLLATNDMTYNKGGTKASWKKPPQEWMFYPEARAAIRASHP